jgi:hypothetical protein
LAAFLLSTIAFSFSVATAENCQDDPRGTGTFLELAIGKPANDGARDAIFSGGTEKDALVPGWLSKVKL